MLQSPNPPSLATRTYSRRAVHAWAIYDVANSAFTTLVVTFIYATYFSSEMASDSTEGTVLWSRAVTLTAISVALLSPYVGAIADRGGYRKRFLFVTTAVCITATVLLYFPAPGQVGLALGIFLIANISFELANVFYNAFLPDITPLERIGRVSGYGWGLGYVGGLACMAIALFAFVQTDTPIFGFSTDAGENIRATNLLVAAWFAVFSIPIFALVKETKHPVLPDGLGVIRAANRQITQTFAEIRRYRHMFRLLLARLFYNDGLITIFAFGGIYARNVFGFTFEEVLIFGIVINVAAGLGAFVFALVDDWIGGKLTVLITLVGLTIASILAVVAQSNTQFWIAAVVIGLLVGPNQSASRSLMGRFTPDRMENEFFGFFAFSGKITAFMGPLMLGLLLDITGSQRVGISSVILFFVVGGLLLLRVNESEGIAAAIPVDRAEVDLPGRTENP